MKDAIRPFAALLKREIWEHRAFWMMPVIISGFITLMSLYHIFLGGMLTHADPVRIASRLDQIASQDAAEVTALVSSAYLGFTIVFAIALAFALGFYLLDSLYADRKDRSFLFWKSMPVSDAQTVLSKLATVTVVAPVISLAVVAVSVVVWATIFSGIALWAGAEHWYLAMNPVAYVDFIITALTAIVVWALILLPFVGWLLLVSAWARRAPFLWAVLPPLGVAWMEEFLFDTNYFVGTIASYLDVLSHRAFDVAGRAVRIGGEGEDVRMRMSMVDVSVDPTVLLEPRLIAGVVVGALFVYGAIQVRRYRDDA